MAPTYLEFLAAFSTFLNAYTHTLLYLRNLYPRTSFVNSRFHNASVYQSRHPLVCEWIRDAVSAVRDELLQGTVARIGIVIFSYGNRDQGEKSGSPKIMERYMFDVSTFPVVDKKERNMEIDWEDNSSPEHSGNESNTEYDAKSRGKGKQKALDADVDVDLSEQFRAAFMLLTTRTSQLKPLPPNCSFNISMELKDESDVDPPIGHPQQWIPVQPSLQKTGRKGISQDGNEEHESATSTSGDGREGGDLGGLKVTPIRSVEAGVFRFETWVEEGKAKLEATSGETSLASSGR